MIQARCSVDKTKVGIIGGTDLLITPLTMAKIYHECHARPGAGAYLQQRLHRWASNTNSYPDREQLASTSIQPMASLTANALCVVPTMAAAAAPRRHRSLVVARASAAKVDDAVGGRRRAMVLLNQVKDLTTKLGKLLFHFQDFTLWCDFFFQIL